MLKFKENSTKDNLNVRDHLKRPSVSLFIISINVLFLFNSFRIGFVDLKDLQKIV